MDNAKVIKIEDLPSSSVPGGASLKRITTKDDTKNFALGLATINPGTGHVWHFTERSDEAMYIMKGKGTLFYRDGDVERSLEYRKGDALFIRAGTRHQNMNTGSEEIVLLSVISPYDVAKEE